MQIKILFNIKGSHASREMQTGFEGKYSHIIKENIFPHGSKNTLCQESSQKSQISIYEVMTYFLPLI